MREHHGRYAGEGRRIGIAVSRFNELVTRQLLAGARECLLGHGVHDDAIEVIWVPGAWEIPAALRRLLATERFDALVALGAVIRGGTPHFEYVSSGVTSGVAAVAAEANVPVAFGVLTTDTLEQALDRAGGKAGNKGWEAALAALETVDVFDRLAEGP